MATENLGHVKGGLMQERHLEMALLCVVLQNEHWQVGEQNQNWCMGVFLALPPQSTTAQQSGHTAGHFSIVLCFLVICHRGSISTVWAGRVAARFIGRQLLALPNEAGQGGWDEPCSQHPGDAADLQPCGRETLF